MIIHVKKRGIFLIIALSVLVIGVIVSAWLIYRDNPSAVVELLNIGQSGVVESPEKVIGSCLFTDQSFCDEAFIPTDKTGKKLYGTIGFDIQSGNTPIYAPTDGYVDVFFFSKDQKDPVVIFTDYKDWSIEMISGNNEEKKGSHTIAIYAESWDSINRGQVNKGSVIGVAAIEGPVLSESLTERVDLSLVFTKWWRESMGNQINDPAEYIKGAVNQMNVVR